MNKCFGIVIKLFDIIIKSMFSNLWILVDIMVFLNIGVYCLNFNVSMGGSFGVGLAMMIIYFIYYIICDQIRLSYRLEHCECLGKY